MAISPMYIATNIIITIVSTAIVTILILVVFCPATAPSTAPVAKAARTTKNKRPARKTVVTQPRSSRPVPS